MLRILLTVAIAGCIGSGLGWVQASFGRMGVDERFAGARATLAETRGEMTKEEVEQQSTGLPKLVIDGGTEFDFGTMMHGETQSHEFIFRNIGDGPLNLEMGTSTCKCTVGKLDSSILQPGEEAPVKLTWTAQSILENFSQSATIRTNDPVRSEIKLEVRGFITLSFVVEPEELQLGGVPVTEGAKRSFYIFNFLDEKIKLQDVQWADPLRTEYINLHHERIEMDPEKYPKHASAVALHRLDLEIKPGFPMGPFNSTIHLATDRGDDLGYIDIPVSGNVTGELSLVGGTSFNTKNNILSMGSVDSDKGASVSVLLGIQGENRDQIIPEIANVDAGGALEVTIGEPKSVGKRRMYPIRFDVPKGAPAVYYPGSSKESFAKVLLKTNHEVSQELTIYVKLIVTD